MKKREESKKNKKSRSRGKAQEKAQARLQKKTQKKLFSICKMLGGGADMVSEQKGTKLFLFVGTTLK